MAIKFAEEIFSLWYNGCISKQEEFMKKKIFAILMALLMLNSCSIGKRDVYLYGEDHDIKPIYNEELNILRDYYKKGGRNYFLEYPHYCAQYLNLWMKSDNDEYLKIGRAHV